MPPASLSFPHLALHSALDVHEMFRLLGYDIDKPYAYEGNELRDFEFDDVDAAAVRRVYIVSQRDNHTVYLYEVDDLSQTRLRGLAWNTLQRGGTALLALTNDYREILFVDPRLVGSAIKNNVRVNKLKLVVNDPTRHDLDTLNAIYAHRRTGPQIYEAQAAAFNVNAVTKRFYDEYRGYYERVRAATKQYNKGVREFQDEDKGDKLHAFAQRLLGRLMFIYFLQRKGWLGKPSKHNFLTGQFLETTRRHADDFNSGQETFYYYNEVLVPLFFDTMNTRRMGNATQWPGVLIPYLNGGLFDPARDPQGPILLPDSLFDPNSNEGVLAFFNRYNFTIQDDTPLEQDVAVDPEMLGKVFENLLEERDRGQSGSFYTPRVIVAYMCQEALAGYLEESAAVSRDMVRAQFDPDNDQHFSAEEAGRIDKALDTLTVLDPAVGSGSFLIGMLQEIIRLRRACALVLNIDVTPAVVADWKEAIIRDTLYGVDIKPEAIEVAQLRLWLALVVEQTIDQARPLPNLDYKLMAGNSLIETIDGEPVLGAHAETMLTGDFSDAGPAVAPMQQNFVGEAVQGEFLLFDSQQAVHRERVKLDALRRQYFRAGPDERKELRSQITSQERQIVYASLNDKSERLFEQINRLTDQSKRKPLSKAEKNRLDAAAMQVSRVTTLEQQIADLDKPLPFFLYRMHFHEVFAAKGGFDVVIANPPYVRHEQITGLKPELEPAYPDVYTGTADLYVYFYARGIGLARSNGTLVYITPNKFMRAGYGKRLRDFLRQKTTLETLIDFGDLPLFDATTYPMIAALRKACPATDHMIRVLTVTELNAVEHMGQTSRRAFPLPQGALTSAEWQISDPAVRLLMDKLRAAGKPLRDYVNGKFYYGIKTGLNEAFVVNEATRAELIAADPHSLEIIKPFLRGRDIKRWLSQSPDLYLIYVTWDCPIVDYPIILAHLENFRSRLSNRPEVKSGRFPWYALSRYGSEYVHEFEHPKIVYPHFNVSPNFTYDKSGAFGNDKTYLIASDDHYLLGVINSEVVNFFLRQIVPPVRGGYMEFRTIYIEQIPVPNASQLLRDQIATLAHQCLDTPDESKRAQLETRLNALVYQAYGLDDTDIQVIEGQLNGAAPVGVESTEMVEDEDN